MSSTTEAPVLRRDRTDFPVDRHSIGITAVVAAAILACERRELGNLDKSLPLHVGAHRHEEPQRGDMP